MRQNPPRKHTGLSQKQQKDSQCKKRAVTRARESNKTSDNNGTQQPQFTSNAKQRSEEQPKKRRTTAEEAKRVQLCAKQQNQLPRQTTESNSRNDKQTAPRERVHNETREQTECTSRSKTQPEGKTKKRKQAGTKLPESRVQSCNNKTTAKESRAAKLLKQTTVVKVSVLNKSEKNRRHQARETTRRIPLLAGQGKAQEQLIHETCMHKISESDFTL